MKLQIILVMVLAGVIFLTPTSFVAGSAVEVANLVKNHSSETAGSSSTLASDWSIADGWSGYTRQFSSSAWDGSYVLALQNSAHPAIRAAAYQRIILLDQSRVLPLKITARISGVGVENLAADEFGASIYAEFHLLNGKVVYSKNTNKTKFVGNFGWRWAGFNTGTFLAENDLPEIDSPIAYVDLYLVLGSDGTAFFDSVTVQQFSPMPDGVVTIMIDDGESSTFTEAFPVLKSYGFKGTASIVTSYVGTEDYLDLSQLHELENAGWEIASHSVDHQDMSLQTKDQIDAEYYDSKQFFIQNNFKVSTFVLPSGGYNGDVLGVGQENYSDYYTSIRGVERGINSPGTFPYDVKIQEVDSTTTLVMVDDWIQRAKNNHLWLILLFHRIALTNSDIYYTTPENFKATIDLVSKSGLKVLPYREALKVFEDPTLTTAATGWELY